MPNARVLSTSGIRPNPRLAAGIILLASAFVAGTTLLAKGLGTDAFGPPLHPLQITFGRFFFAWIAIASVVVVRKPTFTRPDWPLHGLRTVSGWTGVSLMFTAVVYIPLADATAISFLNPVFAMLFAILLLKERVGPIRWIAATVALAGALVLLRPGIDSFQPAALLALGAAMVLGFEIIIIKRLSGREGPTQILFINNSLGLMIAGFAAVWVWHPPTIEQWTALAGVGILMATAQAGYVNALARAESSFVIPFSYTTLIFAAFYDFLIFGSVPGVVSMFGIGIILIGAGLLAYRETRTRT